ncbi:TPA: hypothetical protein N1339_004931 [Salmonella enterica]|nr:hypothetical protein [Salmonella enterica]
MVFNAVMEGQSTSDQIKSAAISIRPESRMRVKVRVLNALRPVSSTTSTIDVLVFMRASPTFAVHALKQFDYREERDVVPIDSFPSDNYAPELPDLSSGTRVKRSEEVPENGISYRATRRDRHLPTAVSNKWNERLPITQMDNGEKEDEDTTENFSVGRSALLAQSLDTQVGIKDILRRPTLLFLQKQCLASETGFFIPLMPPSRMMQYVVGKATDFVKTVGQTPQAALMNLFRFWRGSMRYTIIIHKKTGSPPVYVTHVPHSGVRLFSNKTVGTVADKQIPIYGCGLTTEIIVPQVNPTVCVEAPYDTENNWTLTFDEDALRNYSWRDKGDVTSGHLVLSCAEDFKFSVWWHAGDDFEFANFYGIPKMRSNVWAYQWSDEHARVQMDDQGFRSNNVLTHVGTLYSGVKAALTPNLLTKAALCAIPVVGPAYTTANIIAAVDNAQSHMHRITNQLNDKADNAIDRVVATFGVSLNNLVELIQGTVDKVVGGLSWAANLGSYCYDVILDILIAWIDKSWTAVGVSIVRFLGKVLSTKLMTTLMQYGVQLGEVIANIARPQVVEVQAPSRDTTATLIGVLAGVVGTVLGVHINMYRYTSMMSGIVARLTEAGGMSYLVNVLRFVEGTFTIIKDAILGMLGYVTPEAAALKMLSSSSNVLNVFVTEAQLVTSEANTNLLLHPGFRHRFWKTVMQAYQIQKLLATVPSSSASPVLGKLCNDVIKMGNEKFVDISASPVRYEPFVICIEGAAGIGKSELVDSLASSILSNIEFSRPHSGITYYRMPGSKFWSGYRDQPVVVYDDWMNMTDPTAAAQQLSELYQLKSTSLFIPEMASLEEKKIRGNPLVVILLCNQAFPQSVVSNLVSAEKAVYRRRDILLHARKAMEFANVSPREMTVEQQTTFAHLEFMKYRDQTDRNSLSTRPISYEATRDYVVARFARWHAQEQVKVRRRLNNAMSGMAGANINDLRIEDPFHLYYSVSSQNAMSTTDSQNAFLPSEVLAAEVTRIAVAVQSFQDAQVAETDLPPQPSDPFEITTQGPREAIIATAVSTRLFLGNALTWGVDCLHQWINSKFAPYSGARMECSICQEISYAYAGCPNSTTETSHSVCQSCYVSLTVHNGAHSCPVCRDERFKIHDLEDVARAMGVFSLWCYRTAKSMTDVGEFLIEKFNGSWADAYYMVWRASVSLTAIGSGAATVDEIASLAPFATMVDNFTAPFRFARVQSDAEPIANPFEDTEESQDPLDEDLDIFVCELNQALLEAVPVNRTEQTICGHRWLRGNAHQVTYIAGSFHVYREGGTVTVPESACFDPLCPFTIDFELASFYTSYLREKGPLLRSYLHSFYNAGATDPSTQQYYLERIPPVVRPAWMQVATQARDEITALAQGNWWDRLSDTYTHYKQIIWAVVGVSAAVGGIMAIHSIFKATGPSVQYMDSGDNRTIRVRREVRTLQRPPHQGQVHFQSSSDATPDLVDVVKRYVARNYVKIRLEFGGETRLLTAVGLFNRQALLPRHYVKEIRRRITEGAKIFVGPSMLEHEMKEYTFDESDFKVSATTDLATWTLPPSFGMFKDIRKFISLDADLEKSFAPNATLLIAPCRLTPTLTAVPVDVLGIQNSEVVKDVDGETFTAYDVIAYNYSQAGACGSLLLLDRTTRPIVAMHFAGIGAGKRGEGFGVILTQETLREAATNHTCATQMDDVELGSIDDAKIMLGDANVSYLGSVPPELTIFLPKKTKIRPSLIQNVGSLKPLTQPCILDKTDPRYTYDTTPLVAGVVKHGQLTKDFPSSWVDRAKERLWDTFISKLKPAIVGASRLTYEEALTGFDNVTYYDPVVLSTSAGFPWCTTQKKRKADYVEIVRNDTGEVTQVLIKDEILKVLKRKEDQRREGVVPFTPFVDTLKDERRKPEKLLKLGGTRVFCNPPLDYVIAMRQNFLHFTAAFMASRFEMQHAVGINVNGTEWTQLARRLINVSPNNVCTIDYSNFGPGFNAGVAQAAMQLMIRWVKENVAGIDERELTCLMEECLNSQHLCVNTVYYQKCGSPSGAPITTVINTLVNQLLILVAWEAIMASEIGQAGKYLMEEYQKNVVLFCYGDDLIMSVSDGIRDRFNARTITTFFSDYDIVATDASKSASVVAYGPITKASFLKMTFARHERHKHLWQSQLDWTSINDTTQWVWECANYKEATYENAKAALLAAHGYGKTKFNDFKSQVNQALRLADCPTLSMTWEEVDNLFYPEVVY